MASPYNDPFDDEDDEKASKFEETSRSQAAYISQQERDLHVQFHSVFHKELDEDFDNIVTVTN